MVIKHEPGARPPAGEPADTLLAGPDSAGVAATIPLVRHDKSEPQAIDSAPAPMTGARYQIKRQLGVGGMGEVHLCRDAWLGRDVAMKVLRPTTDGSEGRARFVREARVQGQLEHPAVVPVYDMALGDGGAPYFTMKRIQGETLRSVLDRVLAGDSEAIAAFGRRKQLAVLLTACQAVAFAHQRGVLHRDLKPENIMIGELGEVYVLDWGIARAAGTEEITGGDTISGEVPATQVGSLVGTPGYMSPEQARGETDALSPRSDVYALGCMLFEILALRPYHTSREVTGLLASTMTKQAQAPGSVAPDLDIPPELDALVLRALALDPEQRFESALELAHGLERFLDGQRDAELRKQLARDHMNAARAALEAAVQGGPNAEAERARGMRELGRTLALDPQDRSALELVARVVMSSSDELPPQAEAELRQVELKDRRAGARRSAWSYALWIPFLPLMFFLGVKSWWLAFALDAGVVAAVLYAIWMSSTGRVEPRYMRPAILLNFMVVAMLSAIAGPLFFVPGAAATTAAAFMVSLRATHNTRALVIGCAAAAIALPLGLEWLDLVPASYTFQDGGILILPRMLHFPPMATQVLLIGMAAAQFATTALLIGRAVESLKVAERRNFAQAYRLAQLLPHAGRSGS